MSMFDDKCGGQMLKFKYKVAQHQIWIKNFE